MALPTVYNQIDDNKNKTYYLMAGFVLFFAVVVWIFARAMEVDSVGALGLVGFSLVITGIINLVSYYFSDSIVLGLSSAKEITQEQSPDLFNLVDNLCTGAGIPVPKIYVIEDSAPNAFATGRDPQHAAVCFTTGILNKLERAELEGVAAHELSHIKNRDTLYMTVVVILVGLIALLADIFMRSLWYGHGKKDSSSSSSGSGAGLFLLLGIVFAILSPLIANLIKFAVSRQREYLADASAALLTRNPDGLAKALVKISADTEPLEAANKATAHLYIINPLKDWGGKLNGLFSTHPPIEERISRLKQM
jgi:heat shock protein HtpX